MTRFQNFLRITTLLSGIALTAGAGMAYAQTDVTGFNTTTGPFSDNSSIFTTNRVWDVAVLNDQAIARSFGVDVTSGNNAVAENTTVAGELTGDVDVAIMGDRGFGMGLFPFVNLNPMTNGSSVSVTGGNGLTGPNSLNENQVNASQFAALNLVNSSSIANTVNFVANTGNNITSSNTTVGPVISGDVTATADFSNRLNSVSGLNTLDLGMPDNSVDARFSNNITGPNSLNQNIVNADSTFTADITNTNTVSNDFQFQVDTGRNEVSNNTSVGTVRTGSVRIDVMAGN
ncbi:MAG: hypothetical protein WC107_06855 [Patescibacteria group bacterium]